AVSGPQRTIGYVVGGVGAAGLVAGGVAGVVAIVNNKAAKGHCLTKTACDQRGGHLGNAAKTSATAAPVPPAGGAAALVTGVVLYFTAPRTAKVEPRVGAPSVGLGVTGGGPFLTVEGAF